MPVTPPVHASGGPLAALLCCIGSFPAAATDPDAPASAVEQAVAVIKAPPKILTRQKLPNFVGISADTAGAKALSIQAQPVFGAPVAGHAQGNQLRVRLGHQQAEGPVQGGEVPTIPQVSDNDRPGARLRFGGQYVESGELPLGRLGDEQGDRRNTLCESNRIAFIALPSVLDVSGMKMRISTHFGGSEVEVDPQRAGPRRHL